MALPKAKTTLSGDQPRLNVTRVGQQELPLCVAVVCMGLG